MVIYSFSLWQQQLCFFFTKHTRAINPITRRCIFIIFFTRLHSIVYFTYQYVCLKTIKRWPFHGSLVWPATAFINTIALYPIGPESPLLPQVAWTYSGPQSNYSWLLLRNSLAKELLIVRSNLTLSPPFTYILHEHRRSISYLPEVSLLPIQYQAWFSLAHDVSHNKRNIYLMLLCGNWWGDILYRPRLESLQRCPSPFTSLVTEREDRFPLHYSIKP